MHIDRSGEDYQDEDKSHGVTWHEDTRGEGRTVALWEEVRGRNFGFKT